MYGLTVFGDSVMKGVMLEDGRYASDTAFREGLEEKYGIDADNCCRFGSTVEKGYEFAQRRLRRGPLRQYTLIEFGGNDSDYDWPAIAADPEGEHLCKTVPETFAQTLTALVRAVRDSGSTPVIATLPPISAERYFKWFCRDGINGDNVLRWLGDVNAIYRWQERYSLMAGRTAAAEGCAVIDLRDAFLRSPQALPGLLCDDGIHPNRAGQELIYAEIAAALERMEKHEGCGV